MIGAEGLVSALGLPLYFTVPGRFTIPLNISLKRCGSKSIMIPDERCAGHAADGYARVRGYPAGLIVSAGPGALNALLAVATAYRDYVPLVVVGGDIPTYARGSLAVEEVDLRAVYAPVCKKILCIDNVRSLSSIREEVDRALLEPPKGPLFIGYPLDKQEEELKGPIPFQGPLRLHNWTAPNGFPLRLAREAVKLLRISKKPLILVGNGCVDAHGMVARFAERHSIPVAYTLMGWCRLKQKSKTSVGFCGIRGFKTANAALRECDLLIALGARLSEATIAHGLGENSFIVQVLADDRFHNKAALKVKSSCELFIQALAREYDGGKKDFWVNRVEEPQRGDSRTFRLIKRVIEGLNCSVLSLDMGNSSMWGLEAIKSGWHGLVLYPGGLATMGFSIPAALGAQVAMPRGQVVAVSGDGGALMSLPALHAISKLRLPILTLIFNNGVYGMVRSKQIRDYGDASDVELNFSGFKSLARSVGMRYVEIRDDADAYKLLRRRPEEPVLVEVKTDVEDVVPVSRKLFNSKTG